MHPIFSSNDKTINKNGHFYIEQIAKFSINWWSLKQKEWLNCFIDGLFKLQLVIYQIWIQLSKNWKILKIMKNVNDIFGIEHILVLEFHKNLSLINFIELN